MGNHFHFQDWAGLSSLLFQGMPKAVCKMPCANHADSVSGQRTGKTAFHIAVHMKGGGFAHNNDGRGADPLLHDLGVNP